MAADPITLVVALAVPVLTASATLVWHLALNSRMREDIARLRDDVRDTLRKHEALAALEDERHAEAARDRHADTLANGALGNALARIEGALGTTPPRGGSMP
jgi:hypothetical protein